MRRDEEQTRHPAGSKGTSEPGAPAKPSEDATPPWANPGHYIRRRSDRAILGCLVFLAILGLLTLFDVASSVFITILSSILIALALDPLVRLLCNRGRLPRPFASIVVVFFAIAFLYGILYIAYYNAKQLIADLPLILEQIRNAPLVQSTADQVHRITEMLSEAGKSISRTAPSAGDQGGTVVLQGGNSWGETVFRSIGSLTTLVFSLSFIPFLVYFILEGKEPLTRRTRNLFPEEFHDIASAVMHDVERMMQRYIIGNALVAGVLSVLTSLVFLAIGLPYWLVLGVLSGITNTIPYLGVVLALLPALIVGIVTYNSGGPLLFIVASVSVLHVVAANYMMPRLVGKGVQLNAVASTIAIMFFGWMWGAMGLILGIPIVAVLKCILDNVPSTQHLGQWLGE